MLYKTITLQLLQQHVRTPIRMRMLDRYSADLAASHGAWMKALAATQAEISPQQQASEALELAIEAMKRRLREEYPQQENIDSPLSLEGAMAYLRRHTPHAS
jgi:hypothetical protein